MLDVSFDYDGYKFRSVKECDINILSRWMKKNNNETLELKDGVNIIKCHNCGASIDATCGVCKYCHTSIKPLQEWVME